MNLEMRDDFEAGGVNSKNVAGGFAADVKEFSVRTDADAFRLARDRDDA